MSVREEVRGSNDSGVLSVGGGELRGSESGMNCCGCCDRRAQIHPYQLQLPDDTIGWDRKASSSGLLSSLRSILMSEKSKLLVLHCRAVGEPFGW